MIPKRVVIIFPKRETYEYKSTDSKFYFREQVKRRIDYYVNNEMLTIYCFVEDELACDLLPELVGNTKEIKYLSCFNTIDRVLYGKVVKGNGFKYPAVLKDAHLTDIIGNVIKKTSTGKETDTVTRSDLCTQMLNNRRRLTVTQFLSSPDYIVVYFDKNNQYCNLADTAIGDTRVVHAINMNEDSDSYCFSGQHIDEALFKRVIEEG